MPARTRNSRQVRPSRDDALGRVPPEGYQELPGERHDRDPADPPAPLPDALAEPGAQGGVRLVAKPEPGELDHGVAQPAVAGLRDALLALGPAALPRARRQAGVGGELPSVVEAAEQRLEPEQRAELGPDPLEPGEGGGRRRRLVVRRRADQRVALTLDRGHLRGDQLDPLDLPPDLGLEPRRQGTPVPGPERVEAGQAILAERVVVGDPLPGEQPPDPVRVPGPLLEQRAALTRQPAAVLLLRARRPHHRADAPLAARPGHQRAHELLAVDRVGLGPAMPPVDRDRGRIDDVALDAVSLEPAMHPEAVEAGLLDDDHLDPHAAPPSPSAGRAGRAARHRRRRSRHAWTASRCRARSRSRASATCSARATRRAWHHPPGRRPAAWSRGDRSASVASMLACGDPDLPSRAAIHPHGIFSLVFTLWAPTMAALGLGSLPSRSRSITTRWWRIASHTPAVANARRYSYTVRQGGKAGGGGRWR